MPASTTLDPGFFGTEGKWYYLPLGGLQLPLAFFGLFSRRPALRFHAVQALLYWIVFLFSVVPLSVLASHLMATGGQGDLQAAVAVIVGWSAGGLIILPLFMAYKASKGIFYFPIVGRPITWLVGLRPTPLS